MPGAQCTRGRVCNKKAHALATTGTPLSTGIPCAMVYGLYVLSPAIGLFCHRRSRNNPATLMPASGHQDHTPSPSATSVARLATPPRPPHPAPRS
jgi:hypothetical protein